MLSTLSDKSYVIINSKIAANMFILGARLYFCDIVMTIFIVGASYSFSGYLHRDTSTGVGHWWLSNSSYFSNLCTLGRDMASPKRKGIIDDTTPMICNIEAIEKKEYVVRMFLNYLKLFKLVLTKLSCFVIIARFDFTHC